jgi:hypothetical protein
MATEAPLLHHTQCVAGINLSSTGTSLSGFNGTGQFLVVAMVPGGTARSVIIAALKGTLPLGILQNDPTLGFVADIGYHGVSKVICGGTVTVGAALITAADGSGRALVSAAAGYNWGVALEGGTINQVITAFVSFPGQLGGLT